jgi:hypothetical protein
VISFIIVRGANSSGFIGFVTSDMPGALSSHLSLIREARFVPGPTPNTDRVGLAISGLFGRASGLAAGGLDLAEMIFAT